MNDDTGQQILDTELVVIQASPFCNIDCSYCYLPNRHSKQVIDEGTLDRVFEAVFASPFTKNQIEFLWHAGEPLAVPMSFYEKAFSLIGKRNASNITVYNNIQTNATLVTNDWCKFIREHGIHVGVSIDGPRKFHDAYRKTRSGLGTFDRAMDGVRLLQSSDIPIHNIMVLTQESLAAPDEIWEFFVSNEIYDLSFNVEEIEGYNASSSLDGKSDFYKYQSFFRRLSELRSESGLSVRVRELDSVRRQIELARGNIQSTVNRPAQTLNFDVDGSFSTFSPELFTMNHPNYETFVFGNVFEGGIEQMLTNKHFRAVYAEIEAGIRHCRSECEYFFLCGGGEPVNKLWETGTFASTETMHCRFTVKALTNVVLEELEAVHQVDDASDES